MLRISLQRFAQHDRFVNAAAKTSALLPPTSGQCLPSLRSHQQLRAEADSQSRTAAATNFSGSGSPRGNRREYFLRCVVSSAVGDTRWRTDALHLGCAEAIARQENLLEVATATRGRVDKFPRVLSPAL